MLLSDGHFNLAACLNGRAVEKAAAERHWLIFALGSSGIPNHFWLCNSYGTFKMDLALILPGLRLTYGCSVTT